MVAMRRIESTTSRTAQWTCVARAASSLETDVHHRCDDHIAIRLVPTFIRLMLQVPVFRRFVTRVFTPAGIYDYVIARTKYIDAIFKEALFKRFDQILIFGAGFDTRALRFKSEARKTKIFELDVPITQNAKIDQYRKRKLNVPANVVFVPINFDKETPSAKLEAYKFNNKARSLFILEGLLMYLRPESVDETFRTIGEFAGDGSIVVFDYVQASVLKQTGLLYGQREIVNAVAKAEEQWHFGLEKEHVEEFLFKYELKLSDHKDARELEEMYFKDPSGKIKGRINATHCLVRAMKSSRDSAA